MYKMESENNRIKLKLLEATTKIDQLEEEKDLAEKNVGTSSALSSSRVRSNL